MSRFVSQGGSDSSICPARHASGERRQRGRASRSHQGPALEKVDATAVIASHDPEGIGHVDAADRGLPDRHMRAVARCARSLRQKRGEQ